FLSLGLLRLPRLSPWTAAALLGSVDAAAAALSQLAASFMIESLGSVPRYRLHDLTWEYARRRVLSENLGDGGAVPGRVYQALLTLTRRAHAGLYGGDFEVVHSGIPDWDAPVEVLAEVDASPLAWLENERLNIRAAIEHCAELGMAEVC